MQENESLVSRLVGNPSTARVKLMTWKSSPTTHLYPISKLMWWQVNEPILDAILEKMQHIRVFVQGAMKNNLKTSTMIKSWSKKNGITTQSRHTQLRCQKTMVSVLKQLQALPAGPHVWRMMTWSFEAGWELHTTWAQVCLAQPIPETQTLLAHGGKNDCKSK